MSFSVAIYSLEWRIKFNKCRLHTLVNLTPFDLIPSTVNASIGKPRHCFYFRLVLKYTHYCFSQCLYTRPPHHPTHNSYSICPYIELDDLKA